MFRHDGFTLALDTQSATTTHSTWSSKRVIRAIRTLKCGGKKRVLLIVQDPFTSYYDAKVVADFVALNAKTGL